MPSFNTEVPHGLSQEQAQEKLKSFLDAVAEKYKDQVSQVDGSWTDNVLDFSLTTYGFKITGNLTVENEVAKLAGEIPFAALPFRGKIEKGIASALEKALGGGSADSGSKAAREVGSE